MTSPYCSSYNRSVSCGAVSSSQAVTTSVFEVFFSTEPRLRHARQWRRYFRPVGFPVSETCEATDQDCSLPNDVCRTVNEEAFRRQLVITATQPPIRHIALTPPRAQPTGHVVWISAPRLDGDARFLSAVFRVLSLASDRWQHKQFSTRYFVRRCDDSIPTSKPGNFSIVAVSGK